MAGPATTELQIKLTTPGVEKLPQLSRAFSTFGRDIGRADLKFKEFGNELRKNQAQNVKSINNTRALANTWKELAASVDFGGREFREATAEAKRLNRELDRMEKGGRKGVGGRLRGAAKTVGAVSAAGIFGGPEGLIGAGLGAFGGPQGAVVGGAIGASLGGVRRSIGEIGEYTASLKQQRFALQLVIADTEQYNQAQQFLAKTSQDLAIPQDVIVRQFTALTASVVGAGKSVKDAQDVFLSIASGIRGTGGSLEDMRAAMVATAQVFSKGKVSAEELRQQLGERLPGAFTLFAASMGKTPQELDKALEQGKVTLEDFLGFSKHLFGEYGKNAEILATSPAAAGDRLATEFSKFKDLFGGLFANIGAGLQDTTTSILRFFNDNEETIKNSIKDIVNITSGIFRVLQKIGKDLFGFVGKIITKFFEAIQTAFNNVTGLIN
jgi:tape measure domain-containing protein